MADQVAGASSGVSREDWAQIWRLNIPPKVRMFVRQACKNSLPHAVELVRRHICWKNEVLYLILIGNWK